MKATVDLSHELDEQEADMIRSLIHIERNAGAVSHLNDLHKFRLSGLVSAAAVNWLEIEIGELERDIVRGRLNGCCVDKSGLLN
ncbi:hypothetical protein [Paenibacillus harenae]|uniref:hypothetical protein n=1 Tax=Paenibacillus harenae TaxID=306543 RepID=UPI00040D1A6C|nr:hypothetical protein [Paenibacillus harenae]